MPALPIEGYDTTREDGVTRIRPVYAAPLPVEAVSVQGQGLLPQEPPALPVELPVERSGGILADVDRALSGAVRAPFDALDERLFGKSGKKGTYREAIQKFFKTGPSDEVKTGVNRLLGTGGEERYKTWPEKLVVDAVTGAGDYMGTDPTKTMGMRREDFTDAPPPQAKDGVWFNPVQAEPIDHAVKTAMDISNLAGTGGLAGAGSGGVALGSGPLKQSKLALNDLAVQAKDHFGVTKDAREAGYVLSDGTMLDLTGRHYSGDYIKTPEGLWKTPIGKKDYLVGKRNVDHRELDFYDKGGTDGMREFMNTAQAIRNQPGVGFDTTVVPTNAQLKTIVSNHNKTYRGEPLQVEISNPLTGKNLATKDFAKPNVESVNTWIQQEIKKHPTLFSDNQPSVGIGAVSKSEKPFYSALEKSLGSINQAKATGEQWLGMLSNKGGVKPDELQWSGVSDFLAGKPSVTKAEIEGFLKDNPFGVQEVVKGGRSKIDQAFALAKEHGWKRWDDIDPSTQAKYLQRVSREAGDIPTKYHDYQLPGGENYREVLMTLPSKDAVRLGTKAEREALDLALDNKEITHSAYIKQLDEWAKANQNAKSAANYRSSHWDEPNILAHMRMNDRTIDGKKSLHLEEIQSDWGQHLRKEQVKIKDAINRDFDTIADKMVKAGVIKKVCD